MSERRWFILREAGDRAGPQTTTEIIRALLDERIGADTKLCAEGTETWQEVRTIEEFRIAAKAVRATVQRRMSSRPPPNYMQAALDDDEDEVRTQYFTPGADAARLAASKAPSRAKVEDEDDEEEVRTQYFQPGVGEVQPSPRAAPPARPNPAAPPVLRPRAAPPPVPPARPAPHPPVSAPRAAAPPQVSRKPVASRALPHADSDDEEEVKTQYFTPGAAEQPQRPAPSRPLAADDDEEEVKTQYFTPGVEASQPSRAATEPRPAPPAAAPRTRQRLANAEYAPAAQPPAQAVPVPVAQPVVQQAPPIPYAPLPQQPQQYFTAPVPQMAPPPGRSQQPRGPQGSQIGPHAMTVLMPAVRRKPSLVLIIAGLAAFLIALVVASGVAWLVMMRH